MFTWHDAYYASEWIVRLVMLVYVPQRRSPAAARTWLLLIFILPWVGLLIYAIFGRAYLPQRRRDIQTRVSAVIRTLGSAYFAQFVVRPQLPEQFAQTMTLAENLGDFSIVGGNRMELLGDYDAAIQRLIDDIHLAKTHVHLLYYIFADDPTGRRVAAAVVEAAKRGVSCRVLFDSMGSKSARAELAPAMRAAGIDVHEAMPVHFFRRHSARFDLRNHRKLAVIDGRVGYVGSQNIVSADFKPGMIYEELVVRVTGPVVMQLQAVFLTDRVLETDEGLDQPEHFPEPKETGDVAAQVLPSGPSYEHANNQRFIVSLIHAAQRRIAITTPYFIPDDALLQAMQTAVMRGVDVTLIVSQTLDQFLVGFAQRSYYEDLLQAGVKIYEYVPKFLHAKFLTIDDQVGLVGSSNFDIRSFMLNSEISLIVYDPRIVEQLHAMQERKIGESHEITLEAWSQRPLRRRVAQNMARLFDTLL